MSEWQPIESAPRDGTLILAYEPDLNDYFMDAGYFAQGEWWTNAGIHKMHPTHWMPLPPPPSA